MLILNYVFFDIKIRRSGSDPSRPGVNYASFPTFQNSDLLLLSKKLRTICFCSGFRVIKTSASSLKACTHSGPLRISSFSILLTLLKRSIFLSFRFDHLYLLVACNMSLIIIKRHVTCVKLCPFIFCHLKLCAKILA